MPPDADGLHVLRARYGVALRLPQGRHVEVINTFGSQALDTWALNATDPHEVMSMEHTRSRLSRVVPQTGDMLYTTRRRPILCLTRDTSPGIHDTVLCACSPEIYRELGCADGHRSCEANLHEALREQGVELGWTPGPLNLFMNVSVGSGGEVIRAAPRSRPGDSVTFRTEMDAIVVFSACPQDVTPINGEDCTPRDVAYRVF